MRQRQRPPQTGRPFIQAGPCLIVVTSVIALFTLAAVAGGGGHWRPIHVVLVLLPLAITGGRMYRQYRQDRTEAEARAAAAKRLTGSPEATSGTEVPAQPSRAATPAPAETSGGEALVGTIVGVDDGPQHTRPAAETNERVAAA